MKAMSILSVLLLSALCTLAQVNARFELFAPALEDSARVYIAGSAPALGNWHPARIMLTNKGGKVWVLEVSLAPGSVEYKYTLGSWDRQPAGTHGQALGNRQADIAEGRIIRDTVRNWTGNTQKITTGKITGQVRYHRMQGIDGVKGRDIIVWLPPGYENGNKRYPVLYMQDGQNIIDPATSAFGDDWQVDEAADSLIRSRLIKPLIIVGVYNTPDRNREYIPGGAAAYMNFMARHVKPFIDSAYRTHPSAANNWVGGSSAGGVLAFMLAWEYPKSFSKAICMSPAFKLPDGGPGSWNFITNVKASTRMKAGRFYMDNGGIGIEQKLQPGIDEMIGALEAGGYRKGRDFIFLKDSTAPHNEKAWAARFPSALRWIMKQ